MVSNTQRRSRLLCRYAFNAGKLRYASGEEQELWGECSRLLANAILYYNMVMLSQAVSQKEQQGDTAGVMFLLGPQSPGPTSTSMAALRLLKTQNWYRLRHSWRRLPNTDHAVHRASCIMRVQRPKRQRSSKISVGAAFFRSGGHGDPPYIAHPLAYSAAFVWINTAAVRPGILNAPRANVAVRTTASAERA